MNYEIGNPHLIWLLLFAPAVLLLHLYSSWANRRARKLFGATARPRALFTGWLSSSLLTLGVALLALACMDIRWGKTTREVPQRGLEIVFALDVSRSMLAQDAKPNRLTRAKQQIKDMLSEMAGDRVGLVVFAGEANQAVPLTNHYHDFQQKLDSVGPESVPVGGSQLGVAIKAAAEAFLSKTNDHKTVVLFTDGEDQESQPIELAKRLHAENGLRIFTVGLGDMTEGARIPDDSNTRRSQRSQFVQHNGQQVWSKLNGSILKQIATESNAAYIPAGTKRVNMADIYHRYIANVEKAEFETAKINALIPRYQWFAFPAFVCVFLSSFLGTVSRRKQSFETATSKSRTSTRKANGSSLGKAAAILLFLPGATFGQATDSDTLPTRINAANELLRQQKTVEAIDAYNAIDASNSDTPDELRYNLANAHYRNSDITAAEALYSQTAASDDKRIARDSHYNLGNCHYAKALSLVEQQPELAIEELEKAVKKYRGALRIDRSLADARENLERARKLIEQLKKQNEQEQQQKDQQDQQSKQSQQDQKNERSENQKSQNESEKNQSQENNSQESDSSQQQQSSDGSDDQQSEDGKSESSQENSQKPDSGESRNQASDKSESGDKSEQQSQQEAKDKQASQDSQNQPSESQKQTTDNQQQNAAAGEEKKDGEKPPTGDLSAVNEMDRKDNGEADKPKGALAQQNNKDNGMMTRQEALKLLQAVRDRDMLRRFRKKQRQRQNRVQVEKDW